MQAKTDSSSERTSKTTTTLHPSLHLKKINKENPNQRHKIIVNFPRSCSGTLQGSSFQKKDRSSLILQLPPPCKSLTETDSVCVLKYKQKDEITLCSFFVVSRSPSGSGQLSVLIVKVTVTERQFRVIKTTKQRHTV